MSQGQRALTALAFALAHQADVLLLDEPTNGLDPLVRRECLTQLIEGAYDQGQTIILSSHRLEEVAGLAQDIAILHQGRLVESGPLADLLERDQRVNLRVSNPVSDLAGLPGASRVDQDARQATIYVRGFDQRRVADALAVRGVTEWMHHAVSLEQLFADRVTAHVE